MKYVNDIAGIESAVSLSGAPPRGGFFSGGWFVVIFEIHRQFPSCTSPSHLLVSPNPASDL